MDEYVYLTDRRSFLKAGAGFLAWLVGGKLVMGGMTEKRRRNPNLLAQVYPNLVGCVGQSTNPPVTMAFLNALSGCVDMSIQAVKNSQDWIEPSTTTYATAQGVKTVYRGTMPEFEKLSNGAANQSELLLRAYLNNADRSVQGGICDFISRINYSVYAAAIGDKDVLWIFTDGGAMHVVDLRPTLGQVFFFPNPEVFRSAIDMCKVVKPYIPNDSVIIEMPDHQVWMLQHYAPNDEDGFMWNIRKYKVTRTKYLDWGTDDNEKNPFEKINP